MSDIFELDVYYHVFTVAGDVYVSNDNDGDTVLAKLAQQYRMQRSSWKTGRIRKC